MDLEDIYKEIVLTEDKISPFLISGEYNQVETILYSLKQGGLLSKDAIKYWVANYYIGLCYQRAGQIDKAKRQLFFIIERCNLQVLKTLAIECLGKVYSQSGDSTNAIKCLQELADLRRDGVIFHDKEYIARLQLPALWRLGIHEIRVGNIKNGLIAFDSHKEISSISKHQKANELSCFSIASVMRGLKDYDSYYFSIRKSRELYLRKSEDAISKMLWKVKAAISTLLVEATIDNILHDNLSAFIKIFIVRSFLRKWHLQISTEGIGEIVTALQDNFPEMKELLQSNEPLFREWLRNHKYHDMLVYADKIAIEMVTSWESNSDHISFSAIQDSFSTIKGYHRTPTQKASLQIEGNEHDNNREIIISQKDYLGERPIHEHINVGLAHVPIELEVESFPPKPKDKITLRETFSAALTKMIDNQCHLLCFPEFAYASELRSVIQEYCNDVLVVAGTHYADGHNRCQLFIEGQEAHFDKIIPADFEYRGIAKRDVGMIEGKHIEIRTTKFGRIAILICRDFLKFGPALQGLGIDIIIVSAHNPTAEGSKRLYQVAKLLVSNEPLYVLIIDSGSKGRTGILGRLHRNFLSGLSARKLRTSDMDDEEIVSVDHSAIVFATLDLRTKSPLIPSPAVPSPNIFNIDVVSL